MSWIAVGVTAVSVGTSLYSGAQANKAAKKQAALQEEQGQIQLQEALVEAAQIRQEGERTKQEQMMAYIGSGVEIQGTPLLVMTETTKLADTEAAATEKRGYAQGNLANAQAKITRAEGKAQMIASIGSAVSSGATTYKAIK